MCIRFRLDQRDVREQLRSDVMELSARIGADRVPKELLDEAMQVWRRSGRKAARAHIARAQSNT